MVPSLLELESHCRQEGMRPGSIRLEAKTEIMVGGAQEFIGEAEIASFADCVIGSHHPLVPKGHIDTGVEEVATPKVAVNGADPGAGMDGEGPVKRGRIDHVHHHWNLVMVQAFAGRTEWDTSN